jgi:hypothetical protein
MPFETVVSPEQFEHPIRAATPKAFGARQAGRPTLQEGAMRDALAATLATSQAWRRKPLSLLRSCPWGRLKGDV